jgi:hypothetical protein
MFSFLVKTRDFERFLFGTTINTGVLKMQVQRKNENGVESNCLLLILLMILNFF